MSTLIINSAYILLSASLLFAFIRLTLGPSLADRVVALELIAAVVVGYVGVYAIKTGVSSMLDVAIVIALTGFLATVGFARLLERGGRRDD